MGVVLPGWADEILDIIGVSWPNVDEDDYRDMADAMREFADDIDGGANEAHQAIQGLVGSAGGSLAVEALNAHWGKINGTHLKNLAECGRMAATAMDGVAVLIEGAKIGAIVQLGILAAEVIAAQAAAPFTFGLSELGALAGTQVTRLAVRRIFKEVCQQVAEQVISIALTPVEEALGAMVGDLVVQLGANALGVQDGIDLSHAAKAGKEGFNQGVKDAKDAAKSAANSPMELLSAGGSSGGSGAGAGASGGFSFDPDEHDRAVTGLQSAGGTFRNKAGGKIGRAKSHHGRTRGKDAIADAANTMLDKVIDGIEEGVKKTAKHLDDNMTRGVKQMAKNHHENDRALADHFGTLGKGDKKDPKAPNSSPGTSLNSLGGNGGKGRGRDQLDSSHPHSHTRPPDTVNSGGSDPVDMATGRMFLPQRDIALEGSLPLDFTRRVESGYQAGRWFGPSWSSTVDQRLEIDERGIVFVAEDGLLLSYPHPEAGEPVLPARGPQWPLSRTEHGDWALHRPDTGHTRYFTQALHDTRLALLDEISDRNGNRITFDYDDRTGAPLALRHGAGHHLILTTEDDRITALHLAGAAPDGSDQLIRRYQYTDSQLTAVTDADGQPLTFAYDTRGRVTSWTDSNQRRYHYQYDDQDRCIAEGGDDGHVSLRFTYGVVDHDTGLSITTATDADGNTTSYAVNDRLQIVAETDPLGNTIRTEHDAHDRITAVTDALGHRTSFDHDEHGRTTAIHRPDGTQTRVTYSDLHLPVEVCAPDGAVWRQEYDGCGNLTTVVDPTGATTHYAYDGRGHLVSVTDAVGHVTRVSCDDAGRVLNVTDPTGAQTSYQRDPFGRVIAMTDPLGATTRRTWTVDGRLAAQVHPDASEETWTYDGEGNCTSYTDQAGHTTRYEWTHFDLLAARITPDGARYAYTHDAHLRLTEVTDPRGLSWTYEYDPAGRTVAETDFDGRTLRYAHDAAGRLVSRTNGLGQTVRYMRDALGRITQKHAEDDTVQFLYDPAGRLLSAAGQDSTVTYRRDLLGRVVSEDCDGRTVLSAYDVMGRRIQRTTPSGAVSSWAYDAGGNRTVMSASGYSFTFDFDAAGQETARHFGDAVTLAQDWDPRGRLTSQTLTGRGQQLQRRAYAYRPDDHLTAVSDQLNGDRAYGLDAGGRVVSVRARTWSERYAYDEAGNQTDAQWPDRHPSREAQGERTYDRNRLTAAGGVRYSYDSQGRVTTRVKSRLSRKPDVWAYEWDSQDRLVAVVTPDGTRWRYRYDPLGRRIAKERLGVDGCTVLERTDFAWDGSTLVEEARQASGRLENTILTWDYDGQRPMAQREQKALADTAHQSEFDQRFYAIVTDLVGAPRELVEETGDIAWRARSTLWGATTWRNEDTAYTPLRFPGQYFDAETQLHYNLHRYYDPETARYTSPDPLGLAPAPNPATYVHNPHTWTDPLGLSPDYITVYRKQTDHPLSQRVTIGPNGEVSITGKQSLYVNMSNDIRHTLEYRGGQSRPDEIVAFDMPKSYLEKVRATAVDQGAPDDWEGTKQDWKKYKSDKPEISDPTKGPDLYGIPAKLLDEFQANIKPGSGRMIKKM
ncbi:RHS repeat-associated core domain-containing protein [Streptomyces sioyaensis]|uniref:RHS repeat-associated core domain-containing protein n=1 Tax=Streptomyces sioyaensis TaxID=67364 RepID=UPI0037B4B65F